MTFTFYTPKNIIIHHEAGNAGFNAVNEYHRQKWNFLSSLGFYIAYQYYIEKSGKIYQGRRDTEEGAHTRGWNKNSIGICLQGNFDLEKPNPAQLTSLEGLLNRLKKDYNLKDGDIYGHREKSQTSCPGKNLFIWLLLWRQVWTIQKLILVIKEMIKGRGK